jgi:hypothetical protein
MKTIFFEKLWLIDTCVSVDESPEMNMTTTSYDAAIETPAEQAPSVATTSTSERLYWYRESLHITTQIGQMGNPNKNPGNPNKKTIN